MPPVVPVVAALAFLLQPLAAAVADCAWAGPEPGWNHYYDGRLGNGETVRAVLAFHDCTVSGNWFDSVWTEDFEVNGSLTSDHAVTLTLRRASNQIVATIDGRFPQSDPFGKVIGGPLASDLLLGLMSGGNGYNGQTVELRLDRSWDGSDAQVAAAAGIADQGAFNRATLRFWQAVRDHEVSVVAESARYPLQATIWKWSNSRLESRSIVVRDPAMLKRNYDQIFNWFRRDGILSHLPRHLIWGAERNTIALGGYVVVFDPAGHVVALP